jgi:hypothetical protein
LIPNFKQLFFKDKKSSRDNELLQITAILENKLAKFTIFDKYKRLIRPIARIPNFDIFANSSDKSDQFTVLQVLPIITKGFFNLWFL